MAPILSTAYADPLAEILAGDPQLAAVAENPEHRVQILYTQVDRDAAGAARFTSFASAPHGEGYFYPASTVKLPVALLALEKCRRLGIPPDAAMITGAPEPWQTAAEEPAGVAGYVRKVFLVSDNDAYNRLLEFVGPDAVADAFARRGHEGTRIFHRVGVAREAGHSRFSNPITFTDRGRTVHTEPAKLCDRDFAAGAAIPIGRAYLADGQQIDTPKDFAAANAFPLASQQAVLRALVIPESVGAEERFTLDEAHRALVLRAMSTLPRESTDPLYPPEPFDDDYGKFLYPPTGGHRSFGKSGLAYGFVIDNVYFREPSTGIEFFLAASVYANADGVLNDDRYEYDTISIPFLAGLGKAVLAHERRRSSGPRDPLPPLLPLEKK